MAQGPGRLDEATRRTTVSMTGRVPPFFVLNASWDLGLESDARTFVELLEKCNVPVSYAVVADTNHASACWETRTHRMMSDYIASIGTIGGP